MIEKLKANWMMGLAALAAALFVIAVVGTSLLPSDPVSTARAQVAYTERFKVVIEYTLVHEGGAKYTNHPSDPGGPTKWGVTIHEVRKYLNPKAGAREVRALTKEQALGIYYNKFWVPLKAEALPRGLDYAVFDYAVNAGPGRAMKDLRVVLGLRASVALPDASVFAALKDKDPKDLIRRLNERRMAFQMGLGPKYDVFKRGWRNRINSVNAAALKMAGDRSRGMFDDPLASIPRVGPGKAYEETN